MKAIILLLLAITASNLYALSYQPGYEAASFRSQDIDELKQVYKLQDRLSIEELNKIASKGNKIAQYALGLTYATGEPSKSITKDLTKAKA